MTENGYTVKVPGKLMIAGEYAVLEPGQECVVVAVNRYVTAQIQESKLNQLRLPDLGLESITWRDSFPITFSSDDPRLTFIRNAMEVVGEYMTEMSMEGRPFRLSISSGLDDSSGKKYGLGSSAAVVVSVVTAMLHFYQLEPTRELIFKLAAIAHVQSQGSGSGADVAASTYGGWIHYSAFQAGWLLNERREKNSILPLIQEPWPHLFIQPLKQPSQIILAVGWTGDVISTGPMIQQIKTWQNDHPDEYKNFLQNSCEAVTGLVHSLEASNIENSISSLAKNREALVNLGKQAGILIETPKLKALAEVAERLGGSGKSSGAGGGDCGIAFVTSDKQLDLLYAEWKREDIEPLDIQVERNGSILLMTA
ncbi:phosphomevalonate kinase [Salinibacillus xinjiangensis]|uniref:phosphomevalonate kinase n=1 Tax=Salinibacillus xinjiangensis TaxID=1229268 RepID=A0A6G1X468_9BACI|nr:phosphomevalonate kinase [Salinibacillus xinjiangensis]MRG85705.1 phosphomevalonate kinase [Salinibacillus xinjiangensis]